MEEHQSIEIIKALERIYKSFEKYQQQQQQQMQQQMNKLFEQSLAVFDDGAGDAHSHEDPQFSVPEHSDNADPDDDFNCVDADVLSGLEFVEDENVLNAEINESNVVVLKEAFESAEQKNRKTPVSALELFDKSPKKNSDSLLEVKKFGLSYEKGDNYTVVDCVHDTYKIELEGKDLAYDSRIVLTFGAFPRVKLKFNVLFANKVTTGLKVIIKDSNHGPVDHKLVDKNTNKAVSMFWTAIKVGDRVDSALKDMAVVMKQLDRSVEAIEAIKFFRHLCHFESQESLDNILVELYKRSGNLACYLTVRQRRFLLAAKLKADEELVNELDDDTAVYDNKDKNLWPSIVFYERIGVERSSFSVNEKRDVTVENLKWDCNSELLTAVVRCKTHDSLKSWFFNNNHWYLTQEIRYLRQDGVKFSWDPTNPHQLNYWTLGGFIIACNFVWIMAFIDNSTALVIDDSKNLWVVSLSDSSLCVVKFPVVDSWEEWDGREFNVEPSLCKALGSSVHFVWLDSHVLLNVSHFDYNRSSDLVKFSSCKDGLLCMQEIEIVCSENHISGIMSCSGWNANISSQISLKRLKSGTIVATIEKCGDMSLSSSCPWMSVIPIVDSALLTPFLIIGLHYFSRLHVNGRTLCNNYRSVSFHFKSPD